MKTNVYRARLVTFDLNISTMTGKGVEGAAGGSGSKWGGGGDTAVSSARERLHSMALPKTFILTASRHGGGQAKPCAVAADEKLKI